MAEQFMGVEATGVYAGELVEDMIETVKKCKKLYCNVYISEFFSKDSTYPLTYVPLWALSLPLRKGDKVLVKFNQENLMFPELYKNDSELDSGFYEKFDTTATVSGGNIGSLASEDTVAAYNLGKDSYLIKTEDYTILHQNNGFTAIDKDGKIYLNGTDVNVVASGNLSIDCKSDILLYGNKISAKIQGNAEFNVTGQTNITSNSGVTINNHLKVNP